MKKYLFVVVALLALVGQANAQRYLPGMRGVEFKGGFVDGIEKPTNYYVGVGLSTYTKNGNRWVFGAEYLSKQYGYKEWNIPKAQFTAEGGYYLKFLSDASKTFFLSAVRLLPDMKQAGGVTNCCRTGRRFVIRIHLSMEGR